MNRTEDLLNKINTAPRLDFGTIFNDALELFKKTWLFGFLYYVVVIIISIPISMITNPSYFNMIRHIDNFEMWNDPFTFNSMIFGPYVVMSFLGSFVTASISTLLLAGFLRIVKHIDQGLEPEAIDLFFFFKSDYIFKAMALAVVLMIIAVAAIFLCFFPIIYVSIGMTFCAVIFAFNPDLRLGEIIKAAFTLGHKKWWLTFGLVIVAGLLSAIIGLLMCGVGIFLTASFTVLPTYLVYKSVIGFDDSKYSSIH